VAADVAQHIREDAQLEAARRRQDAAADAESELEMAKQQGREMVNEARAYRERVLTELSRRRELARQQIEQLVHGRDRLVQAFERARLAAVDVMTELVPLGEPAEYVNLAPTTGPVPVMLPNTPAPADHEAAPGPAPAPPHDPGERMVFGVDDEPDAYDHLEEPSVESETAAEIEAEIEEPVAEVEAEAEEEVVEEQRVVSLFAGEVLIDEDSGEDEAVIVAATVAPPVEPVVEEAAEAEEAEEPAGEPAEAEDVVEPEEPTEGPADEEEVAVDADAVDDLFARLRAARAESVAERARLRAETPDPPAPDDDVDATRTLPRPDRLSVFEPSPSAPVVAEEVDDSPFGRRDAALTPLIITAARKLKRVLADEQNDVLHALRRSPAITDLEPMLPTAAEHAQRYAGVIEAELVEAAAAGAASLGGAGAPELQARVRQAEAIAPAVATLVATIVEPLRDRMAHAVADAGGDTTELASVTRAVYREWKIQQIDEHLDEVVRIAFGRGALAGVEAGTPVKWVHDPRVAVCADCDDNALTGIIPAGEPFATGQPCAPAHEGCRCMLATAGG
jgi:hypothetical protein